MEIALFQDFNSLLNSRSGSVQVAARDDDFGIRRRRYRAGEAILYNGIRGLTGQSEWCLTEPLRYVLVCPWRSSHRTFCLFSARYHQFSTNSQIDGANCVKIAFATVKTWGGMFVYPGTAQFTVASFTSCKVQSSSY